MWPGRSSSSVECVGVFGSTPRCCIQFSCRSSSSCKFQVEVINDAQRSIKDIEDAITQACCGKCSSHVTGDEWLCESQVEGCQTRLVHMRYARPALQRVNYSQECVGNIVGPVCRQRRMEVRGSESLREATSAPRATAADTSEPQEAFRWMPDVLRLFISEGPVRTSGMLSRRC